MIATEVSSDVHKIQKVFQTQKKHQYQVANTNAKQRIQKLKRFRDTLLKYKPEIRKALWDDFHKPVAEVDLTEIYTVTGEIRHTIRHLRKWMSPQKVGTPLSLFGSTSWIHYEPKGVCLIIAPWNYPINLTFSPLVSAIAAGNTVILKPSEHTPHASAIMRKIVEESFDENEVAYFEGGVETATELLALPFNHVFFTGAPSIGKIVMAAAAKHLTSVTLELGGKSPTIIDETADVAKAVSWITFGKFSNNGQICIAPDHVFVHEQVKEKFLTELGKKLNKFYGDDVSKSPDYTRIVNRHHFNRLKSYLDNSVADGAKVVIGGKSIEEENFIEPTVVVDPPLDCDLMENEIFGPILPVMSFSNLSDVVGQINEGEKPLALYIYSKSSKNTSFVLKNTRAGGTCINNNAVHYFNNNLPFGGSNNSGIGKSRGWFGFDAFSNARGVYRQDLPSVLEKLVPPYSNFAQKIIDMTIKWL